MKTVMETRRSDDGENGTRASDEMLSDAIVGGISDFPHVVRF